MCREWVENPDYERGQALTPGRQIDDLWRRVERLENRDKAWWWFAILICINIMLMWSILLR
jgi:hypothetical protein